MRCVQQQQQKQQQQQQQHSCRLSASLQLMQSRQDTIHGAGSAVVFVLALLRSAVHRHLAPAHTTDIRVITNNNSRALSTAFQSCCCSVTCL
jgi:hypothetical protein